MSIIAILVSVIAFVVLDTIWLALFRVLPLGKFRVLSSADSLFSFKTNVGAFSANQERHTFVYSMSEQRGSVPFSAIKGLEYRVDVKYAYLQELFFGFDLTDLLERYRDTVEWFSITLVTLDGKRIPLYLSGEYCPREFFASWYIELQASLLQKFGIIQDVEMQSRAALDLIRTNLGEPQLV